MVQAAGPNERSKMTLHIHYSHRCSSCASRYIPYDKDVSCPKCGIIEEERFDFIPRAVDSLCFNQKSYGSYVPPAWIAGSLGDRILSLLFKLFDTYEHQKPPDFKEFATVWLSMVNWGDHQYLIPARYGRPTGTDIRKGTVRFLAVCLRRGSSDGSTG